MGPEPSGTAGGSRDETPPWDTPLPGPAPGPGPARPRWGRRRLPRDRHREWHREWRRGQDRERAEVSGADKGSRAERGGGPGASAPLRSVSARFVAAL